MQELSSKQSIVLAADWKYSTYVLTTIKSICWHNKNICFYLLNRDYPVDWFDEINVFLSKINCQIIDVKFNNEEIKKYPTYQHISSDSTFFRYYIGDLIQEDKVLYLDCDLIITGNLDELFEISLYDNFVAACIDNTSKRCIEDEQFNAGVLLINNKKWREYCVAEKAIDLSERYIHQVPDADQSILNMLFAQKWKKLDRKMNYLVGADYQKIQLFYEGIKNITSLSNIKTGNANIIKLLRGIKYVLRFLGEYIQLRYFSYPNLGKNKQTPLIVHFNTEFKPWLDIEYLPFSEQYKFYQEVTLDDVIHQHIQK